MSIDKYHIYEVAHCMKAGTVFILTLVKNQTVELGNDYYWLDLVPSLK